MTAQIKPTKDVRQAWLLAAVALGLIFFFGLVVLPYIDPATGSGQQAQDFSLEVIHGGEPGNRLRLHDLRGKVVVLDFWASWCKPCRAQSPIVDAVAKKFESDEVMVVGVNTGDTRRLAQAFLKEHPVSYASVIDEEGTTSRAFGVTTLPTIVVIDRQGRITYSAAKVVSARTLSELVTEALENRS